MSKNVYVIAGPNGAGKTTFAREFLPHFAKCDEFVNADLIATGLSPFSPQGSAMKAGRLVLERIHELAEKHKDFGFETTLAGKTYLSLFKRLRKQGYQIHLFYLWLPNVNMAIQRVRDRMRQGGHEVPEEDIRRRFSRSARHLLVNYRPLLDTWTIFDNSEEVPRKVVFGSGSEVTITEEQVFAQIQEKAGLR